MQKTFFEKVYEVARHIPKGKVATYQQIARLAGNARAARAVGTAMKQNPNMHIVPCHRVVGSDGTMHGYSAQGGIAAKIKLLRKEGVRFIGGKVDLTVSRWKKTK